MQILFRVANRFEQEAVDRLPRNDGRAGIPAFQHRLTGIEAQPALLFLRPMAFRTMLMEHRANAFFKKVGFLRPDDGQTFSLITGTPPIPAGFYPTRISTKLAWIYSVIAPAGDANGNGLSNLLEYARDLNSPAPAGPAATPVGKEGTFLTLTYNKLTTASSLQYAIKKSADLVNWSAVTPDEIVIGGSDDVQTIKARVPITGARMFLRLEITEPPPANYILPRRL